jgi:medium-chain acyl-[acyl-carrier-protein] hydrolase
MQTSPWFVTYGSAARASLRLFCFPYGGGGTAVFRDWQTRINPGTQVIGVELPGRGTRFNEPLLSRAEEIVGQLLPQLVCWMDKPYVFFGHSIGALIAYETACALQIAGRRMPNELIASGARAPHIASREPPVSGASDEELVARLRKYGGVPDSLLENAELMELMLPVIRADFAVGEAYRRHRHDRLTCPITALGGEDDPWVTEDELRAWQNTTRSEFQWQLFAGNHFFLHSGMDALLARIDRSLARHAGR